MVYTTEVQKISLHWSAVKGPLLDPYVFDVPHGEKSKPSQLITLQLIYWQAFEIEKLSSKFAITTVPLNTFPQVKHVAITTWYHTISVKDTLVCWNIQLSLAEMATWLSQVQQLLSVCSVCDTQVLIDNEHFGHHCKSGNNSILGLSLLWQYSLILLTREHTPGSTRN